MSDLFELMKDDQLEVLTKQGYLNYLKAMSYGQVPSYIYDNEVIDELWSDVVTYCGSEVITRSIFSKFVSTIDLHLLLTVSY
jgi:5-methylthioribose kinase